MEYEAPDTDTASSSATSSSNINTNHVPSVSIVSHRVVSSSNTNTSSNVSLHLTVERVSPISHAELNCKRRCSKQKRKIAFKAKNFAYVWVVDKIKPKIGSVLDQYWATEVSQIFGIDVKGGTVRKMIRNGDICLQASDPGMAMGDEAHSCMERAILSNINLCQRNGDTELNESLLKGTTVTSIPRSLHLWHKIKSHKYVILELSEEQLSELQRQMWTTAKNLDEWYDR
jgi:hypothetical protein